MTDSVKCVSTKTKMLLYHLALFVGVFLFVVDIICFCLGFLNDQCPTGNTLGRRPNLCQSSFRPLVCLSVVHACCQPQYEGRSSGMGLSWATRKFRKVALRFAKTSALLGLK